jgi:cytochrome c peroxidase
MDALQTIVGPIPGGRSVTPRNSPPLVNSTLARGIPFSQPYLHTGSKDRLEDVVRSYVTVSGLARTGQRRNGAPELSAMHISESDVVPLAAFLRALNEDYE